MVNKKVDDLHRAPRHYVADRTNGQTRMRRYTANHWGLGLARITDGQLEDVQGLTDDPAPSPINHNIAASLSGRARLRRPAVRKGWLDHGPGSSRARGTDPFVEIPWDRALDLLAAELTRVRAEHGNGAIFAGSYGWGSAGRFHHPQSQLKRFLNSFGGFVRSNGNYSFNAALVLMPHIVGDYVTHLKEATRLDQVARHGQLVVAFGGLPTRNTQISDGGIGRHDVPGALQACADAGVRFVNLSPLRRDMDSALNAEWLAPRPGTDVAVMMGLAHTLLVEDLHDRAFLDRYTTGFDRFAAYLRGDSDGVAKTADWASALSGIDADRLRDLARTMAAQRTLITCGAGLQRADWGEQPLWMCVTLAAMLGQVGLPGGGWSIGLAVNGNIGVMNRWLRPGALPQGQNPVRDAIPVAMVADMLLHPGATYEFNGAQRVFPDIRMVWWAGGNPFHHHQDLNRLSRAFERPDTIVVNEVNWTATARQADIVLPVAAAEERDDFVAGKHDNWLIPAPALVPPPAEARTEYDIFGDLSRRLGIEESFTQGRSQADWLAHLWDQTRQTARDHGIDLPDWETFLTGPPIALPDRSPDQVFLADFHADPDAHPLPTPSGRIEIFSAVIDGFGYDDYPGHPTWIPPRPESGALALLSGQPATRLHSQLDNGAYSLSQKIAGREPVLIHPDDASARGIADGDVVELSNTRGACLAGARITADIAPGTLFLWTGAWFDPDPAHPQRRDRHGNPNVLTHDLRTSRLAQGPAAHSCRVDLRKAVGPLPPVTVHDPPRFEG
ncbi:MAG: molybdopterin-dependent oxidoreductase [Marinibacterium sp.]|nr:molybdopterin-dependent oxidoreductase [Marinibacterium sp.]